MGDIPMFHPGSRDLQDHFGSRALADRLVERLARDAFTDEDRAFIESRPMFFLATADDRGRTRTDMTEAQLVAQGEGYMFALVGCAVCAVITGIAALFIRFSPQQVAQAQEAEKAAQNA